MLKPLLFLFWPKPACFGTLWHWRGAKKRIRFYSDSTQHEQSVQNCDGVTRIIQYSRFFEHVNAKQIQVWRHVTGKDEEDSEDDWTESVLCLCSLSREIEYTTCDNFILFYVWIYNCVVQYYYYSTLKQNSASSKTETITTNIPNKKNDQPNKCLVFRILNLNIVCYSPLNFTHI